MLTHRLVVLAVWIAALIALGGLSFVAAAIVLAIAFGSLWATLPLTTAILALGCGLSLTGLLACAPCSCRR